MTEKSIYKQGSAFTHLFFIIFGLCMFGFSIYLTNHYFEVKFPTGLTSSGLCNINQFFNCDTTTNSPASNIFGVPVSLFGILAGLFLLAGYAFSNKEVEGTNHFLLRVNFFFCILFLLYSLIGLGGLCPVCTAFYIASGIVLFLFHKNSSYTTPSFKIMAIYLVITLIASGIMWNNVNEKVQAKNSIATSLVKQYYSLPNLGKPKMDSPFRITSATEVFSDAPLRMTIFSDFECPACKLLSEALHKIVERYKGKINIQYFFYPLDHNCNPSMKRPLHQHACNASYVASCLPEKFGPIHDEIFENQDKLSKTWLNDLAKRENAADCVKDPATKQKVQKLIEAAGPFNIRSTPTFLINGVKIEGVLPANQFYIILDEILKRAKK